MSVNLVQLLVRTVSGRYDVECDVKRVPLAYLADTVGHIIGNGFSVLIVAIPTEKVVGTVCIQPKKKYGSPSRVHRTPSLLTKSLTH